jgi:hypothetical protein
MQKHHWYVVIGTLLAGIAPFIPVVRTLHSAGLGVFVAGCIDWYMAQPKQS